MALSQALALRRRWPLQASTARPGATLPAVDLVQARAQVQEAMPRHITDQEFASWLMYPKVFRDYLAERTHFGDVSVLPTRAFFYGLEPGEEITLDLEKGKHLIVRYVATSDVHDDGTRTVFFELNGQPRSVKVADRSKVAKRPPRRKAGGPASVPGVEPQHALEPRVEGQHVRRVRRVRRELGEEPGGGEQGRAVAAGAPGGDARGQGARLHLRHGLAQAVACHQHAGVRRGQVERAAAAGHARGGIGRGEGPLCGRGGAPLGPV